MSITFLNLAILIGLSAVAIPPLIHLLNRRRYDVVEWGAMQFLEVSQTTRRRLMLEELLLMALRMGLIALVVLALASPQATGPLLGQMGNRAKRDVVLVLDCSSSMTLTDGQAKSPFESARAWALDFVKELTAGDRVTVLLARQPPEFLVGELTQDLALLAEKLAALPAPRGNPDWPRSLEIATGLLKDHGKNPRQEIILLTDNQRFGWADPETLSRWEKQASPGASQTEGTKAGPRLWLIDCARGVQRGLPNYSLASLKTTRALAWLGQKLKFSGALRVDGLKEFVAPHRPRFEVDGKHAGDIPLASGVSLGSGQVPFSFEHRFTSPGAHLVSVLVEPDVPTEKRTSSYRLRDCLPADNRQDLAIEVVRDLPVLLVDGAAKLSSESSTFFLDKALTGPSDAKQTAMVLPRAVPFADFTPAMLEGDKQYPKPRVVILADVPLLTPSQAEALDIYLAEGGGVWVILGPRVAKSVEHYNNLFYRQGQGWLPARLDAVEGDEAKPEFAASPDVKRMQHAALALFQEHPDGSLPKARFPRWWKVTAASQSRAVPGALLTTSDPLLIEQPYKNGRVLLCTVPLDRSWGSNFPGLWDFPVFVHELVYALADARSGDFNLQPGQPFRLQSQAFAGDSASLPERLVVTPPQGSPVELKVPAWPFTFDRTGAVGPYRVQWVEKKVYFVVHPDPRESDLTPCSEEDRQRVARYLPVNYVTDTIPETTEDARAHVAELWWVFLALVTLLLCGEVWWTRRMVRERNAA